MGSIEVYNLKREKWVPYIPDYDNWYQHFKDLSEGYVQPYHMGRYIVGSGRRNRKLKEMEAQQRQKELEIRQQQRLRGETGHARGSSDRDSQIRNRT